MFDICWVRQGTVCGGNWACQRLLLLGLIHYLMVTPLFLLSLEDNLMMNCLPVSLSMFMIRSSTRKLWGWSLTLETKDAYSILHVLEIR